MWSAIYNSGHVINQFNEDNTERMFRDIDQDQLSKFIVRDASNEVILNIKTGEVKINGVKISFGYENYEHRLIYFRRVTHNLGTGNTEQIITMHEYVGWQATVDNKNIKRIIILEDERVIVITE
jgi:hypothetical protein